MPSFISFIPTPPSHINGFFQLVSVSASDVVYDLGSGDGRIPIAAAKRRGARGVGIEIDPALVKKAREIAEAQGVGKRVRFVEADLFEADIHDATVVVLFLAPELNLQLVPKLKKDLRPGTKIVSNTFDIYGWQPERELTVGDANDKGHPFSHKLYLWTVPQRSAGTARN